MSNGVVEMKNSSGMKQDLEQQQSSDLQQPQPQRRLRGFAAAAAASAAGELAAAPKGRKEREKEKERTKLRERHRRSITSRMLAGLRQYGNFPLPARPDMNDVLAALAREAGWTVEADGTTYRPSPPPGQLLMMGVHLGEHENDFTGTAYIPVYVILPAGIINSFCQLVDPEGIQQELRHLKSLNVDGVVVDCWWGIVEGWSPRKYLWSGYRELFNIIREFQLKLQVVMAFHECGGNGSGDMPIPLPKWVMEIGKDNQDIFFTDREGRRNTECLSWGIDKERVLKGRTGIEVYFDFMRSFRMEFDDLFAEGLISGVEIGLGASGELKYPSFAERMGWRYPGIGEFQCYDKYLQQSLRRAAKLRGHSFWARGPDNAGQYNSRPHETGFFCERGDYDSYYGRFFLHWYAQTLIDHADHVLSLANLAFEDTQIIVKIPAVYWWYRTSGHAAELTAGFYNPTNQEGYSPIFDILKKHSAAPKFVCSGLQVHAQEHIEALADLEALSWQVLNSAWDRGLTVAGQNALPCYDREGYSRILETSKPRNHPDRRHMSFFAYQQLSPASMQRDQCISELDYFIKCMHGEATADHEA
ncbi:beta-amylase 8-like isoform X2 [Magnolia sinica]|uniref:beta-amylase 8-like isoform X2 n=1 Tax=Magnolia sinica TaxID=86752 RepID=UPI0026586506|nr:beta-amylase 8-like isoform X2 [Magnolia sinica]